MILKGYIEGIGLLGSGLNGWQDSQAVVAGSEPYRRADTVLPPPALLPPAERRRSGTIVKLTLAVGQEAVAAAGREAAELPSVYTASGGDGANCHAICEMLASDDRLISPTRFHNSVHNAASGYWSIATGAMTSASVLCAYDASFGAGLLDALTQVVVDDTPNLLLACDTPYPEPLHSTRPIPDAFGVALVLAPRPGPRTLAAVTVELTGDAASQLEDAELESLRRAIPAARCLPMLRALARQEAGHVVLDYLDDLRLSVSLKPC